MRSKSSIQHQPVLGLVSDTGLSVTQVMGHLGCLASHWSNPVLGSKEVSALTDLPSLPSFF